MMRWLLSVLTLLLASVHACAAPAEEAASRPLKVAMYSGSAEYNSAESLADLKKELTDRFGMTCSLHVANEKGAILAGIDDLETCDVAIIFTRRLKLDDGQIARLKKYCDAGRPIVGIRTASHAFQTWLDFDRDVLGGSYKGHYGTDRLAAVKPAVADHPVLRGVRPFTSTGKLYKNPDVAADVTRLLSATTDEATEPVAWVRRHRGGRIFYTSLGTPDDFRNADFRRLLVNAIFWTAKRDVPQGD